MTEWDVAVIGGGSAGRAAAREAAIAGASVLLIDEATDRAEFTELPASVDVRTRSIVWGVWPGFELALHSASGSIRERAARLILATGATARTRSFPGSDFPGVMTGDGLLRMLLGQGVWPGGKRVAIVGDDEVTARRVADAVVSSGGRIVGTIPEQPQAFATDQVLTRIAQAGTAIAFDVDIAALCWGEQPDCSLALMLECGSGYSRVLGGFVPASNDRMETSQAGVYVCGSAAGIAHVDSAVAEGRLAGAAAAASLGFGSAQIVRTLVAELHACDPERVAARSQVLSTWRQHTIEAVRAGGAS